MKNKSLRIPVLVVSFAVFFFLLIFLTLNIPRGKATESFETRSYDKCGALQNCIGEVGTAEMTYDTYGIPFMSLGLGTNDAGAPWEEYGLYFEKMKHVVFGDEYGFETEVRPLALIGNVAASAVLAVGFVILLNNKIFKSGKKHENSRN